MARPNSPWKMNGVSAHDVQLAEVYGDSIKTDVQALSGSGPEVIQLGCDGQEIPDFSGQWVQANSGGSIIARPLQPVGTVNGGIAMDFSTKDND